MKRVEAAWQALQRYRVSFGVYFLVGGAAAIAEWTLFWLLLQASLLPYLPAALCGFGIGTLVNWLLSRRYAFLSRGGARSIELLNTYLVSAVALAVNLGVLVLLVERFWMDPLPAKILGTGSGFLLNYCGRQFWVFQSQPRH